MGLTFYNVSIRKTPNLTQDTIADYLCQMMKQQRYQPTPSAQDADASFAIYTEEASQWFTVYSDLFPMEQFVTIAEPMSKALHTDVLRIFCLDSDFLYLNLFNAAEGLEAHAGVGETDEPIDELGDLSPWKTKVENFSLFQQCVEKDYVFAEEALYHLMPCLGLPREQAIGSFEYLADLDLDENSKFLYFTFGKTDYGKVIPLPIAPW